MKKFTLIIASFILLGFMSACSNNQSATKTDDGNAKVETKTAKSLEGTYVCTEHWNEDMVGSGKIIFKDDHKVDFSGMANTSYEIKGDSVFMDMHSYKMGFKIVGNAIEANGSAGKVVYTKE